VKNKASDGPAALRPIVSVSRETEERLEIYAALLRMWQARINLVAPSTLPELWSRHIADSAQLLPLAPQARVWADLGSGAGLPGLVIAVLLADRQGAHVHLIESNGKKAAFLRTAIRETDAPATVHDGRIERVLALLGPVDAVTARALAPLPDLLGLSATALEKGAVGIFPKGREVNEELTLARRSWTIDAALVPSRTDPEARILIVRSARPGEGGLHG